MAAEFKTINQKLVASSNLAAVLDRDSLKLRTFAKTAASAFKSFALPVLGGFTGVAAISQFREIEDEIDSMANAAKSFGMSIEDWQGLSFATKQVGADVDALGLGMKRIAEIAFDPKKAGLLGLAPGDITGGIQGLGVIGDRLNAINDPFRRAAVGAELFGKAFERLDPLLQAGSKGLTALMNDMAKLNPLTTEQAARLNEAGDAIDRLGVAWANLKRQTAAGLAVPATHVANATTELVSGGFFQNYKLLIAQLQDASGGWLGPTGRQEGLLQEERREAAQRDLDRRQRDTAQFERSQQELAGQRMRDMLTKAAKDIEAAGKKFREAQDKEFAALGEKFNFGDLAKFNIEEGRLRAARNDGFLNPEGFARANLDLLKRREQALGLADRPSNVATAADPRTVQGASVLLQAINRMPQQSIQQRIAAVNEAQVRETQRLNELIREAINAFGGNVPINVAPGRGF